MGPVAVGPNPEEMTMMVRMGGWTTLPRGSGVRLNHD